MSKSELSVAITGDAAPLDRELRRGAGSVQRFSLDISGSAAAAAGGLAGLGFAAAGMGVDLVRSASSAASGFAQWSLGLAAEAEQASIAFGVMLGGESNAKSLMGELTSFAASTPFEFPELRDAAKSLVSFGVAQEQVLPAMKSLGDLASGLGIPINDLAQIYGKAKTSGKLAMDDINQLAGLGIPIYAELAKQFKVGEGEVRKLVEEGKVGFPNLQKAVISLTGEGGKFGGMMERQSQSLSGLWSTLQDTIGGAAKQIGEVLIEELGFKQILSDGTNFTAFVTDQAIPIIRALAQGAVQLGEWGINSFRGLGASILDLAAYAEEGFGPVKAIAVGTLETIATVARAVGMTSTAAVADAAASVLDTSDLAESMRKTAEELRKPIRQVLQEWRDGLPVATKEGMREIAVEEQKLATKKKDEKKKAKPDKDDKTQLAGLDMGSREAVSAILQYRRGDADGVQKQQVSELKMANKYLEKIAANIGGQTYERVDSLV